MTDYELKKSPTTDVGPAGISDDEKQSTIETANLAVSVDREIEKRILRKFDLRILPLLTFMYLCSSMDLSNLGNAKSDNIEGDLHMKGNQYNILLSIWYIPIVLFGPPMNILTKKYGAALVLPIAIFGFGSFLMFGAATKNWGGIMTTRWFLGVFESGFYPAVIFYLTLFYKRTELAGRLGAFFAAGAIANGFTGLIAYGCFQIKGDIHGWQYLFLIEGAVTILSGVVAIIVLPHSAARAKFLTPEEKEVAYTRMARDSSSVVDSKFVFKDAIKICTEDKFFFAYMMVGISNGVPLFSVSTFLVQIVQRLGYGTVKTNLLTVAPNVVGAVSLVIVANSSDYFRNRALHIVAGLSCTMIGFIILASVDVVTNKGVAYFACFLLCAGCSVPSPLLATWYNNNTPDEGKRAIITSIIEAVATLSGLISSNIFRPQDAPNYIPALAISAAFGGFAIVLVTSMHLYMRWFNAKKDREQGVKLRAEDVSTADLTDGFKSEKFRYMY
ncbi:putative transporter [Hyphodiscus hymeniophilus]|uniref:Transporter n=1 Tax=Hyphodiscus hymeniophilus TaxID=353542 RepID=A0A9P7AWC7_9HELO|nr:putative transporter [Hyphodiscus hymeniophilus]